MRHGFKSVPLLLAAAIGVASYASSPLAATAQTKPAHEHKEGEAHHDDEDHGPKTELGKKKIGDHDVQVTLAGEVKEGEEAVFIIKPTGKDEPKAVRAWVGVETGQGSIKTKGEEEKEGEWHAHHKVSKPMPANSKVWVELETSAGKKRASFDLKK